MIRGLIDERGSIASSDVQKVAGITRQAVHYHLQSMVELGEIQRSGRGRGSRYHQPGRLTTTYAPAGLEEHEAWKDLLNADRRVHRLPDNVVGILRFAFTEMVNNAIDHSKGTAVEVARRWSKDRITLEIADDGIGAFFSVRRKFHLRDDFASIQAISKGKSTTDPDRHAGEGIFFTSKVVDRFAIEANGLRWIVDNLAQDQAVGDSSVRRGTLVRLELDSTTKRTTAEVFDAYTDSETLEFDRTSAAVRLFLTGPSFVSRSEARRVAEGLERFDRVSLDFAGVTEVGQGFVDELFRVWAREHARTQLVPSNMSPAVEAMVSRGLRSE